MDINTKEVLPEEVQQAQDNANEIPMASQVKEDTTNLKTVKSIVTLALTACIVAIMLWLVIAKDDLAQMDKLWSLVSLVFGFYFGRQSAN